MLQSPEPMNVQTPLLAPDDNFEPWLPRMTEEARSQEEMALLAHACLQDVDDFRYITFITRFKTKYIVI